MAQKSRFKMQTQGITTFRKTFPQLPGGMIENPRFIQTAHGFVSSTLSNRSTRKSKLTDPLYPVGTVFWLTAGGGTLASR